MTRFLRLLSICIVFVAAACGDDEVEDSVQITLFQAAPDAIELGQSTKLVFAVDPPDATISISSVGDVTGKVQASVNPTATTVYQLTATKGTASATSSATVTVGPASAAAIKVEPASGSPIAGDSLSVQLTAIVGNGTTAPGFRGTVRLTSSDPAAELPPDVVFTAADAGVKTVKVTLKRSGLSTLTGTDVASPARSGTAAVDVQPAAASAFELTTLQTPAIAGESLVLTITARDPFGNVGTNYAGQARLISGDPTDILPPVGGFVAGVRTVSVAFRKAGSHFATVQEVGGLITADTNTVAVGPAAPFRIAVSGASPTTIAGTAEPFTVTMVDFFDNVCTNYLGTVHFATTANADLPADYTFAVEDAGSHTFTTTLKSAGTDTVVISDTVDPALTGFNSWNVGPAAAATCSITQTPATTFAGSVVGATVALHDPFANLATTYAGTIRLTATDARATLPPDVTYSPGSDAGRHAFSASLFTAGAQTLTATDTANPAIHCAAQITVTPGAPKLVLSMQSDANAGFPVNVAVAVKDAFDNVIPNYTGTVSFTSTDSGAGAVNPAPVVFTGSEGGVATTTAAFVTLGAQTITASDGGTPVATGSAASNVHGLVYIGPTTGRVRLVANPAQSNTQVVQLDLVANERLEVSSFFGGGPGSFAAGMNLPLDTNRVAADSTLFIAGNALVVTPPAPNPPILPVGVARLAGDHVLYAAVSRRRVAGPVFNQLTEVQPGRVFFSVRLRLQQNGTVGPVFDGALESPLFRASVRDQYGDDFVNQGDFGIGRLEIR